MMLHPIPHWLTQLQSRLFYWTVINPFLCNCAMQPHSHWEPAHHITALQCCPSHRSPVVPVLVVALCPPVLLSPISAPLPLLSQQLLCWSELRVCPDPGILPVAPDVLNAAGKPTVSLLHARKSKGVCVPPPLQPGVDYVQFVRAKSLENQSR